MSHTSFNTLTAAVRGWELRFDPLFAGHRGFAFPCDALGNVHWDGMSERAQQNYLHARSMLGRETAWPRVQALAH